MSLEDVRFKNKPFDVNELDEIIVFNGKGDLIEFYREGKYIYLIKPKEKSKRYFRFNLQTGKFERINIYKTVDNKITEVPTKNITFWFRDCKLVTKDIHFGRLVVFAKYNHYFDQYSSPVRFIEQLGSKVITNIEKWEALGVKVYETESFFSDHLVKTGNYWGHYDWRKSIYLGDIPRDFKSFFSGYLSYGPGDFNKNVLNHILKTYPMIDNGVLRMIHRNYNNGENEVEEDIENLCKDPEFHDALSYVCDHYQNRGATWHLLDSHNHSFNMKISLIHLIQQYHLDLESLLRFLKRQRNVENNGLEYLINARHYADYLRCEYELNDGSYSKMNKYPKNFRTVFHNVQVEHDAKKAAIDKKKFEKQGLDHKYLEHEGKKYLIKVPTDPAEIYNEAAELDHCVRIYIPRVVNGETLIAFLRVKDAPQQPFVTLEVKNGILNQAYGQNDSKPDDESLKFLKRWLNKKGLKAGCWRNNLY